MAGSLLRWVARRQSGKNLRTKGLALLLTVVPLCAHAVNLRFLDQSLMAQLKAEDITALRQQIGATLDKSPDQRIIKWASTNTGIQVQIKPKLTFSEGASECRRTLFKLSKADHNPEYYSFDICKDANDGWKVRDSLISQLTKEDWSLLEGTLNEVLESDKDNKVPASWFNGLSRNSGVIVPVASLTHNGTPCREVTISVINSNGGTMDGHYTFCKKGSEWERLSQ